MSNLGTMIITDGEFERQYPIRFGIPRVGDTIHVRSEEGELLLSHAVREVNWGFRDGDHIKGTPVITVWTEL